MIHPEVLTTVMVADGYRAPAELQGPRRALLVRFNFADEIPGLRSGTST